MINGEIAIEGEILKDGRTGRAAAAIRSYLNGDDLNADMGAAPAADLRAAAIAFDELACDRAGSEKMAFALLIFDQGRTMVEAASRCYISYATAKRWKAQVLDLVIRHLQE